MAICKDCGHKDCTHYEVCRYRPMFNRVTGFSGENCVGLQDRSKFVELQCKPGDVVYHYCEELHEILDYTVYCINLFRDNGITYHAEAYDEENAEALSDIGFEPEDIGRDVFLTREEAERELKGNNNEKNN